MTDTSLPTDHTSSARSTRVRYRHNEGSAARLRLPRNPRRLQAAICPDAMNDRQFCADLLACDLHHRPA